VTEITAFRFSYRRYDSETAVGAFVRAEIAPAAIYLRIVSLVELAAPKLSHNADAVMDRADGNSDEHGEDEAVE
jgi:hypothetical protein